MTINFINSGDFSKEELEKEYSRLAEYVIFLKKIRDDNSFEYPESSINNPFNTNSIEEVRLALSKVTNGKEKYLFLAGIGGSNLGPEAIYNALNLDGKQIFFLDTINTSLLTKIKKLKEQENLTKEDILISIVSESGKTTETIFNGNYLMGLFDESEFKTIFTTKENSELSKQLETVQKLLVPKTQVGRYSVFSKIGILPFEFLGIDTSKILEGAQKAVEESITSNSINENKAALSAIYTYLNLNKGKVINNNFYFNPRMETVGKWLRQLIAESLGKEEKGILPNVSVGTTDLHSTLQHYLGGTNNIYTNLVFSVDNQIENIKLDKVHISTVPNLTKTSAKAIIKVIYENVVKSYKNNNRVFSETFIESINEYELGYYMQFKMLEVMYLGKLLEVNPFNQPNVEEYKEETRKFLEKL